MADENGTPEVPTEEETPVETTAEPTTTEEEETPVVKEEEGGEPEYIRDPILETEEMRKVFVGGITLDATDEELKEFFERMSGGIVSDVNIIKKEADKNKKSLFGFITFETSENVDDLLLKREDLKFKDRTLDVNRAVPKNNLQPGAREKVKKLFIANLPKFNCCEDDLQKYFEARHPKKYGLIESIQLIKVKDDSGAKTEENRGYGFVNVSSEDLADKMAIEHANFEFGGRKIELKKSVPTAEGGGRRGGRRGGGGGSHQAGNDYSYGGGYGGYGSGGYDDWTGYGGYGYGGGYSYGYPPNPYGYGPPAGGRGRGGGGRYKPY